MDAALLDLKRQAALGDSMARMRYDAEIARRGGASPVVKVAFDSETAKWAAGCMVPPVACWTWARRSSVGVEIGIATRKCPTFRSTIEEILSADLIVGHNVVYELTGVVAEFPDLTPRVWELLAAGRVHDTAIREKLINLATHGKLDMVQNLDGTWSQQNYSLAELEKAYAIDFGVNRKAEKTDEDAWRNHYELLLETTLERWPAEAVDYAKRDAHGTLLVHDAQEDRAWALRPFIDGRDCLATQGFQTAVAFALRLSSVWGFAIDLRMRDEIERLLKAELAPEKVQRLVEAGILIPPVAPRQRKNGTWTNGDPDEHIKQAPLHALITRVCEMNGLKVKRTESGKVSADKEVMETLAGLDETLDEYRHRQELQKLVQEIERMSWHLAYTRYDVLKETGRTSSKAEEGIPSSNIQNKPAVKKLKGPGGVSRGEINIRHCYVARRREYGFETDNVLCSVDYSSLEFVSMAQTCYRLFGYSVMRDLLNAGVDPHAYLGGQLALHLDEWFRNECQRGGISGSKDEVYKFFISLKDNQTQTPVYARDGKLLGHVIPSEKYEKFRKLAKPVGFGYPGGLGAKKFISFAKAQYDVTVTQEEAELLKEIFFSTYPEMGDYFNWITSECVDPNNSVTDEETGRVRQLYRYVSLMGLVRSGATYTAACNGALLQTPAAEGAKLAVFEVQRACYDPSQGSVLYGCPMVAFVHDEIILEMPDDHVELRHARAMELARIMIEAMKTVMPDLVVKAEPALMFRWDKSAKKVLDRNGYLDVWRPKQAA